MNNKFIPLSIPNLNGNELNYVTEAIETEWVSTVGKFVSDFEINLAKYVKSNNAISCQNGTAGLHTSLIVCDVTKEDAVIVPALTFIAAVNPVKYIGAEPIFMDCDDSLCMDTAKLRSFCEEECDFIDNKLIDKVSKKNIKAVLVVHVFGNMADMETIMELANKYNFKVVEDATEALGTYYTEGKNVGKFAGTIADVGVYSFNGNKIMTTGGGGMIVTDNDEYAKRAKHLSTQAKSDELYYIHDEVGYNYRMTNLQAGLGLAQLEQLETFIKTKNENYQLYKEEIKKIDGLEMIDFKDEIRSNKWFYSLNCDKFVLNRDELIKYFAENKIQTRPIWGLICDQIPYLGTRQYKIEKAKYYLENIVNIPCSTNLSKEEIRIIIDILCSIGV